MYYKDGGEGYTPRKMVEKFEPEEVKSKKIVPMWVLGWVAVICVLIIVYFVWGYLKKPKMQKFGFRFY